MKPRVARRFVPVQPTLGSLLGRPKTTWKPFPLREARARSYYLGRNALWHGLKMLRLAQGARVLMPAYHHGVEVETLRAAGIDPIYYRIDAEMKIDLDDLAKKLDASVRAVYVIHYLGLPQAIEPVLALCRKHGVYLIEDCALALLARAGGAPIGAAGDISIFCLYKMLPLPDGGVLLANRADFRLPAQPADPPARTAYSRAVNALLNGLALRHPGPGLPVRAAAYELGRRVLNAAPGVGGDSVPVGGNSLDLARVNLGMSRLARSILERLDLRDVYALRRRNYSYLAERVPPSLRVLPERLPEGACPLLFPVRVPDKAALRARLCALGVEAIDFWSAGDASVPPGVFAEVEQLRRQVLGLPVHQDLRFVDLDYVVASLHTALA